MDAPATLDHALVSARSTDAAPIDPSRVACTEHDLLAAIDASNDRVDADLAAALAETDLLLRVADARGGHRARARARRARAHALNYANRFDEAERVAREGIAAALHHEDGARLRMTLVHTLARLSRLDEALHHATEARTMLERAGEITQASRARINEGVLFRMRGDLDSAAEAFRLTLTHPDHDETTRSHARNNLGETLLEQGHFVDAERHFRQAAEGFASAGRARLAAIASGNLADLLGRQGRLAEAASQFELARRYFEADHAEGDLGRVLTEHADVQLAMGLLDDARTTYRRASLVLERAGMKAELARALRGEASTLLEASPLDAENPLRRARTLFEQLGNLAERAKTDLVAVRLELARGNHDAALALLALARTDLADRRPELARCSLLEARIDLASGRAQKASASLHAALEHARSLGARDLEADALFLSAQVARATGDHYDALRFLRICRRAVEHARAQLGSARHRESVLANRRGVYAAIVEALLRFPTRPHVEEAFETAESSRSTSLVEQLAATGLHQQDPGTGDPHGLHAWAEARQRVSYLYSRADTADGGPPDVNAQTEIAEAERKLSELESRVSATRVGAMLDVAPPSAARISAALGHDEAVLAYWRLETDIVCFVLTRDAIEPVRLRATSEDVENATADALFQIRRGLARAGTASEHRTRAVRDALRSVARAILDPVAATGALEGRRLLTLVPSDTMHALPLSALRDDGAYLVERFDVATLPSAALLPRLRAHRVPPDTVAAFGVPDRAAPRIQDETAAIAESHPSVRTLSGPRATWDAVRHAAPDAGVLHLACHGVHLPDGPTASALKLADQWVTGREIMGLRLPGSVVVLSGCDTGRLSPLFGDEVHGLARCFFVAGARGLITSLWPAHDDATCRLMANLYRLAAEQVPPSSRMGPGTLARAQRDSISAGIHPALWAHLAYVGG